MKTRWTLLPGLLVLVICGGCAQTSFMKPPGQYLPSALKKSSQQPTRILCLWETAEGQGLDGQSSRGFAGQILFFGYQDAAPITVDGTVRIYQYDEFDPEERNPKPIHVFVFDSAGWNKHLAESTVGESYNVFLPYVKRENGSALCALKVEYIPKKGRSIFSPITEITLEGRRTRARTRSVTDREVSHRQAAASSRHAASDSPRTSPQDDELDTLTIRLPQTGRR